MGVSSKIGTIAIGKQTAKGAAAATPTHKYRLAGSPTLMPQKNRARLETTDSGRDQGLSYTQSILVEGDMPVFMYPDGIGILMYGVLGAHAVTGSGPYEHVITPANDVPWFTIWRMVGGNIFEKFTDCKLNSVNVEGTAGNAPIATINAMGCNAGFEASDTVLAVLDSRPYLYHESCGTIEIESTAYPLSQVSFGINNNLSGFQADCVTYADIDPGQREVTLSFLARYVNPTTEPKYRETYYGSDAGTALSDVVATKAFSWLMTRDADYTFLAEFPQVVYSAVPVNPDTSGDPIEIDVSCEVEKPAGGAITTITVSDETATY
jgi:hypothetical protein